MEKSRTYMLTQRHKLSEIALFKEVMQFYKHWALSFYSHNCSVSVSRCLLSDILQLWDFHLRSVFKWSSSPRAPKAILEKIISQVGFLFFYLFKKNKYSCISNKMSSLCMSIICCSKMWHTPAGSDIHIISLTLMHISLCS